MKRPERIKIISKRFTIEYTKGGDLAEDHMGECRSYEQRILIEEGLKYDTQKETLFHEVLHAISDEMLEEESGLSETQVTQMSRGVLAVLMDNPLFARYLLRRA